MAIGLHLPTSRVPRLRESWQRAATCFAQQAEAIKVHILRFATTARVRWQRLWNAAQNHFDLRARTRQRKRAQLHTFEERFEDLTDLLCLSAHEGIRPSRCEKYSHLRAWMRSNYPALKPHLRPYWKEAGIVSNDPFLALFASDGLEEIINAGCTIEEIMRARLALAACQDALEAAESR